ncbi:MAG: hypothetical protein JO093_22500 [Acidobacteria bacterium]|nr:hypothetical protein [Acidobacteriota bacterium]MBV9071165.1 hypothetical protein [Acidobacteriota bacterium]MBV9188396.1 hypothetical protein [Acidobacteriota bacterium]
MSNDQNISRTSARNGFLLGIGTAAIIGALAIAAVRYDGTAKAVPPQPEPVTSAAAVTDTFPLAEHVAAMSGTTETPAAATTQMPPSSNASQSVMLSGTIALDPSAAGKVTGPVTVFVIARDKTGKGHPILAKRLDVASFPAKFTLGAGDSMMGGTPPNTVSLEARIDLDRDAMTKEPGAPSAKMETVTMGTTDVVLNLK